MLYLSKYSKIKLFLKSHSQVFIMLIIFLLTIFLLILTPVIIYIIFKYYINNSNLLEAKDILQYVISSFSFVGMTFLGGLTFYVNKKLKDANEKMAEMNEKMSFITCDTLKKEKRTDVPLLDFVLIHRDNKTIGLKAEFLYFNSNARIRIWMHNPLNSSIQSAKIISASLALCDLNFEADSSNIIEMVSGDQSTNNVSILPKRECIFVLHFPWKKEFAGKNIYALNISFVTNNNFEQELVEKVKIVFSGTCSEELVSDSHWPLTLYSQNVDYRWKD